MKTLDECRAEIDAIDRSLLSLLSRRLAVSEDVARAKKATGRETYDPAREKDKLDRARAFVPERDRDAAEKLMRLLFELSRQRQRETGA